MRSPRWLCWWSFGSIDFMCANYLAFGFDLDAEWLNMRVGWFQITFWRASFFKRLQRDKAGVA